MLTVCVIGAKDSISFLVDKLAHSAVALYTICFLCSGVVADTLAASIILPLVYVSTAFKNKTMALIIAGFGIASGSNLTFWGGGDNILGWQLTEDFIGYSFGMTEWLINFWPVIIVNYVVTALVLMYFYKDQDEEL